MESSYTIDADERLVRLTFSGRVTAEALTSVMKTIGEDPQYRSGMNAVADFRDCSGGAWDYSEIQRFRDYVVRACGVRPRRWASIVRPGEIEAIGRVLIVIAEAAESQIRIQLFENTADAQRWIGGKDA